MLIIIDLDGTIIDTELIERYREARKWKECVARKHWTQPFPGVAKALEELSERGYRIAVVTSSVSYYASAMLQQHSITYDTLVAYHDTKLHKPQPEPLREALRLWSSEAGCTVNIGDSEADRAAGRAANIKSFAAAWNPNCDVRGRWDAILNDPAELRDFLER